MKTKGLSIQEAIKSGRPFRRPLWSNENCWFYAADSFDALIADDILATDWELKPEKIEPVVFEDVIVYWNDEGALEHRSKLLKPLAGKRVKVTVEAIEETYE